MLAQLVFEIFHIKMRNEQKTEQLISFIWSYFPQYDLRRNMKADSGGYPTYLCGIEFLLSYAKLFLFNISIKI